MLEGLHKIAPPGDTIVALATPWGRAGLGLVRLSGPAACQILTHAFQSKAKPAHRRATQGHWLSPAGQSIDEVMVTCFLSPHSYTGEDVVEISGHGNPVTLRTIVDTAISLGARIATPGEFTLRAVINGKMDLLQAEAVREFVDAQTENQARIALKHMEGGLSRRVRSIRDGLIRVVAHLEAGIDFAEDDVEVPVGALLIEQLRPLAEALEELGRSFEYGKLLAGGLCLVILGKPNVGKSSLFNRLVAADRAIVTEVPGTTRDVVTEVAEIDGVPLKFADTAGVRPATDVVERIGVSRTMETLADADLALVVLDASTTLGDDDRAVLAKAQALPHIIVLNKSDLPPHLDRAALKGSGRVVSVSALTGHGLGDLREGITDHIRNRSGQSSSEVVLTSVRQREAVASAGSSLGCAIDALVRSIPHEMVLLDLYDALESMNELTGETLTEDILDRIFSTFCVGK